MSRSTDEPEYRRGQIEAGARWRPSAGPSPAYLPSPAARAELADERRFGKCSVIEATTSDFVALHRSADGWGDSRRTKEGSKVAQPSLLVLPSQPREKGAAVCVVEGGAF